MCGRQRASAADGLGWLRMSADSLGWLQTASDGCGQPRTALDGSGQPSLAASYPSCPCTLAHHLPLLPLHPHIPPTFVPFHPSHPCALIPLLPLCPHTPPALAPSHPSLALCSHTPLIPYPCILAPLSPS